MDGFLKYVYLNFIYEIYVCGEKKLLEDKN